MRKIGLIMVLAIIMGGLAAGCAAMDKGDAGDLEALTIRDVQSDPLSFTGTIKINGIASAFSDDDNTYFAVMDKAELFACKNLYCGAYAMPARYSGTDSLPELADEVDLIGGFVQTDTGYYFEVTGLEVKQNIMKRLTLSNPGA